MKNVFKNRFYSISFALLTATIGIEIIRIRTVKGPIDASEWNFSISDINTKDLVDDSSCTLCSEDSRCPINLKTPNGFFKSDVYMVIY